MNTKFLVTKNSNTLAGIVIFDNEKMCLVELKNGVYKDITEDCKKLAKRKDKVIGGLWYKVLTENLDYSSACIFKDEIVLETDNKHELDQLLFATQLAQLEWNLEQAKAQYEKKLNNKQYYTYRF